MEFTLFQKAWAMILQCCLWGSTTFFSIMTRFEALSTILTLVFVTILYRRLFGKYSYHGQSDGVRKTKRKKE